MTCLKGALSGVICCGGYDNPDTCNSYEKQYICPGGLIFKKQYNCYECAKTCSGCFEMRIKFGLIKRDAVDHLLR